MTLLAVREIEKSYNDRRLLRGVSLVLNEGEHIGLLGANGCGKSTLLRILAGELTPDAGERTVRRDLRIGYLAQEPRLDSALTVRAAVRQGLTGREEVLAELARVHDELASHRSDPTALLERSTRLESRLEELGGHDVEHRIDALLDALGLSEPDVPCGRLSGGEQRRVALAKILLARPECLLLDEPTNHLDAEVTDWLEDWLLEARTPLLMVTHDRYFLDRVADRIVEIDRGVLYAYDGNYSDYLVARLERLTAEEQAESSRLNLLRRETTWMKRGPPARTTKAKARIGRYQDLVAGEPEAAGGELALAIPSGPRLGQRVLRLEGVSKSFAGRKLFDKLDLELEPGMRLGVVGPNGAGKSTLLKLCLGDAQPDEGRVILGETAVLGSIDQARSSLDPGKTVVQEVAGPNDYVKVGDRSVRIETFLESFLFPGEHKHALVRDLSGGEKNRVLLAKLLCAGGNVLALDEPTNDLDLSTLRALEEALIAFPGAVLVVSHDRWFLDRVATKILYLDGRGGARHYSGDLSSLLAKLAEERATATSTRRAPAQERAASTGAKPLRPRGLSSWEQREYDALPDQIMSAEAELEELDRRIADPAFWSGPRGEIERTQKERAALGVRVGELYRRWEELETLRVQPR